MNKVFLLFLLFIGAINSDDLVKLARDKCGKDLTRGLCCSEMGGGSLASRGWTLRNAKTGQNCSSGKFGTLDQCCNAAAPLPRI